MKLNILISILAFILYGCSTTYTVLEPSSSNLFSEGQLTRKISGEKVRVEFTNGKTAEAWDFRVEYDSCRWVELNSSSIQMARTMDIRKVVSNGHMLGALEGMGIGLLAGTLVPAAFLLLNPPGGDVPLGGLAVLVGWAIGGSLGTFWGAVSGHSYEYEFVWFSHKSTLKAGIKAQPKEKSNKE